ncbi:hypothetical protein CUV01_04940 [Paracoccus tegillarcae]|uniref:TonB C-terminal domain-containing protein n=1 Tax=Paracoccus tegillarcae TaxID=1529068 RepID=A0A2K9ED00_9RHOB|nr:hypothetical protein CUV01_04940 [Paracoccus tegillarcae]
MLFAASVVLLDNGALGAEQAAPSRQPIGLASDAMSETIKSWEAPPAALTEPQELAALQSENPIPPEAPQIEPVQPPAIPQPQVKPPEPMPAEAAPQIALPPLRPAMAQALALPTAAPEIPSALSLRQSERPVPRAARPAPQPRRQAAPQAAAPRQQQSQPAAPAPQQGASGGGGAQQPAPQRAQRVNTGQLMSQWARQLSSCLNRRARAPASVRGGGQVILNLQIGRNGAIQGVSVARSSGNPALDQAAVTIASRVGRCQAAPRGLDAASYPFQLPINLR